MLFILLVLHWCRTVDEKSKKRRKKTRQRSKIEKEKRDLVKLSLFLINNMKGGAFYYGFLVCHFLGCLCH